MTEDFIAEWLSAAPFVVAHTSGSTGAPKQIRLLKSDMIASARATNAFFGLGPGSLAALPLSAEYIAGKMMIVRGIVGGYKVVQLPVSNTIVLPDDGSVFDILPIVPSQAPGLLAHPQYARRIRNLLVGGAMPDADVLRRLCRAGFNAWISYGMTETCSHVALARADDASLTFRAMPGVSFATAGGGRLVVRAPAFSFGELTTNDVVELRGPGAFRWRGRADNVINSGGLKLHPEELERLYAPFLPGRAFYVAGRPDRKWGRVAALVVEGDIDGDAIMTTLRRNIPHRLCPKRLEAVPAIPRTPNGKIKRI